MIKRLSLIVLLCVLTGCLTPRTVKPPVRYVINPTVEIAAVENSGRSLAIRDLEPGRPYKQNVVFRNGDQLGIYTTVEWAELPSHAVTRALTDALLASGRYSDVGDATDLSRPDLVLTGQLRRFDLVRDTEPWAAVCEIRLELREGLDRKLVWQDTVSVTQPLATSDYTALPAAMNSALSRLVQDVVTKIVAK